MRGAWVGFLWHVTCLPRGMGSLEGCKAECLITFIDPSNIVFIGYAQAIVNPICITPIAPVHVNPVTTASTTANFIAVAIWLCAHHIFGYLTHFLNSEFLGHFLWAH
jgi:hypothetical protein